MPGTKLRESLAVEAAVLPARSRSRGPFHPANRIRPLRAWRSIRTLLADPDATGEVFKIIEALKGGSLLRAVERLEQTADGRALLSSRSSLVDWLGDRAALAALPEGSLGRVYLRFVECQQISADGLVAASEEVGRSTYLTDEERWMGDRLRDVHDLQHVLTGYGRDELGELCLLGFMDTQTRNRGIAFISFMGERKYRKLYPQLPIAECVREGRAIARAAAWLAGIAWEQRLHEPLEALRRELRLQPPVQYLALREQVGAGKAA